MTPVCVAIYLGFAAVTGALVAATYNLSNTIGKFYSEESASPAPAGGEADATPPVDAAEVTSPSEVKNPDGSAKEAGQQYEEIIEAQRKNPEKIQSTKKSKQRDKREIRQEAEDALDDLRGDQ